MCTYLFLCSILSINAAKIRNSLGSLYVHSAEVQIRERLRYQEKRVWEGCVYSIQLLQEAEEWQRVAKVWERTWKNLCFSLWDLLKVYSMAAWAVWVFLVFTSITGPGEPFQTYQFVICYKTFQCVMWKLFLACCHSQRCSTLWENNWRCCT